MYVVLELHQDGDGYLKYRLDRIDVSSPRKYNVDGVEKQLTEEEIIEDYCNSYEDKIVLFNGKAYLNNKVISEDHDLEFSPAKITVDKEHVEKLISLEYCVDDYQHGEVNIYGSVYYIFETDGTKSDIKSRISYL